MAEATYGPAEVCAALGIKRDVLHGWAARGFLDFAEKARPGVARRFRFVDVVRIAAMHHMTTLGMNVDPAKSYIGAIDRVPQPGDMLVATCDPLGHTSLAAVIETGEKLLSSDLEEFKARIKVADSAGHPVRMPGIYVLDLFELATQIRRGLDDGGWRTELAGAATYPDAQVIVALHRNSLKPIGPPKPVARRGRRTKPFPQSP